MLFKGSIIRTAFSTTQPLVGTSWASSKGCDLFAAAFRSNKLFSEAVELGDRSWDSQDVCTLVFYPLVSISFVFPLQSLILMAINPYILPSPFPQAIQYRVGTSDNPRSIASVPAETVSRHACHLAPPEFPQTCCAQPTCCRLLLCCLASTLLLTPRPPTALIPPTSTRRVLFKGTPFPTASGPWTF